MSELPYEHPDVEQLAKAEIARARERRAQAEASIPVAPLELVAISAGIGFVCALLLRV
jgi:hypothetical protein